jgi:DNA polymerase (family 10)
MPENNKRVAELLREYANLLYQDGERNRFKLASYRKAAKTIEALQVDITTIEDPQTLKGIGKSLAVKILEIIEEGDFHQRENLAKKHDDISELIKIPGIGPARAIAYVPEFNRLGLEITTANFRKLIDDGEITVPDNILTGLTMFEKSRGRIGLDEALIISEKVIAALRGHALKIEAAGSLRRRKETIGDIDILAASTTPGPLFDTFKSLGNVLAAGDTKASIDLDGVQVDLRVIDIGSWGAAMLYFTGSKDFNIWLRNRALSRGWTLNEYELKEEVTGKHIAGKTEEEVFSSLDLPYIIPEMRESGFHDSDPPDDPDSIIKDQDFDLHVHTQYSDGADTVADMARKASGRGYRYLGFADHSKRLFNRFTDQVAPAQWDEITAYPTNGIILLRGLECEILSDGSLDTAIADQFDYLIGAIHYAKKDEDVTDRYIKAIQNPKVRVLAHLTGRRKMKDPMKADWDRIFKACADANVALELNAQPDRLDLPPSLVKRAKRLGCRFIISSDAHSTDGLATLRYGVWMARKAGLTQADIFDPAELIQAGPN